MTTMASYVKTYLSQDPQITSHTSDRIYDYDVRTAGAGESSPPFRSASGETLIAVIVDDTGGIKAPFGPANAYQDRLDVVIVVPNTVAGRSAYELLRARILVKLVGWQEVNTKAGFTFANRTGFRVDEPPRNGAIDVLTFTVAGTLIGVSGN